MARRQIRSQARTADPKSLAIWSLKESSGPRRQRSECGLKVCVDRARPGGQVWRLGLVGCSAEGVAGDEGLRQDCGLEVRPFPQSFHTWRCVPSANLLKECDPMCCVGLALGMVGRRSRSSRGLACTTSPRVTRRPWRARRRVPLVSPLAIKGRHLNDCCS